MDLVSLSSALAAAGFAQPTVEGMRQLRIGAAPTVEGMRLFG